MPSELQSPTQSILGAIRYAASRHRHQMLSDGYTPYISHVFRVTWILRDHFNVDDHDLIIATLLHDVIEDTPATQNEITKRFGPKVAGYVEALTKDESLPKKHREKEYLDRLVQAPEPVQIAKLADVFDNLSARIGTVKLRRTLENARRLTAAFSETIVSAKARRALSCVQQLISEIEAIHPRQAGVRGSPNGREKSQG